VGLTGFASLKRDEHGAGFFLPREMRSLARVPMKNENEDLQNTANIREHGTTDEVAVSFHPAGPIL